MGIYNALGRIGARTVAKAGMAVTKKGSEDHKDWKFLKDMADKESAEIKARKQRGRRK